MEIVVDVTNLGGRCFTVFNEACQFICKTKMLSTFFFKFNDKHVMVLSASKQINSQLKPTHTPQEIIAMAEQLNTKRKVRADFDKSQPITVNVSTAQKHEKEAVLDALKDAGFKVSPFLKSDLTTSGQKCYGNVAKGKVKDFIMWGSKAEGITPSELFAMVYEDEPQGHPHAELMMAYAEDAKTHRKPWKLWQFRPHNEWEWRECFSNLAWGEFIEYRRKPKTHLVHGVEVPDLRIKPKRGESYYYPYSEGVSLVSRTTFVLESRGDAHRLQHNLCYEDTEAGKQAAILHAKAMLGIAQQE